MRLKSVEAATGLKRPTIYEKMQRGVFPRQVKLSPNGRAVGWFEDEIAEYQAELAAARDRR
jgi:prophage regulatory protein